MAQQYEKKELRQHIFDTPDTYVGGIESIPVNSIILKDNKITNQEIEIIPALINIFNEILVNARDQIVRLQQMSETNKDINKVSYLKINITDKNITVTNDGDGISVKLHEKEKIHIPQLIFGELLTSSNYKKNEKKIVGGKNGYGAKLVNIFSEVFTITTVDKVEEKKYTQTWEKNMTVCQKPTIRKYSNKPFTTISYDLDFNRFGIQKYSDELIQLLHRRVYDIAGITDKSVKVYLNDELIKIKSFLEYVKMFDINKNKKIINELISDRWDICVTTSDNDTFEQVSFVNGIHTSLGGSHVDFITKLITNHLSEFIKKKHKKDVPDKIIKRYISVYINSVIENPSFSSQTKEKLITTPSKFGSKPNFNKKFYKDLTNHNELIEKILDANSKKENKDCKQTDGKKKNKIIIPKLDDANWAGTRKSEQCTLILTEGDSAKSMAIAGLSVIGRDKYGVFPLRGKVLNVRDANIKQINDNKEIVNIKKILGLETNKKYKDIKSLRYGKIMIMTDQDHDGFHIKGLLLNMFHSMWPELLNKDFISYMNTPIVKVSLKKDIKSFYTLTDYNHWKESTKNYKKYNIKYYKGLGTSTASESKEYFKSLKLNTYVSSTQEITDTSINLAFNKKLADNRKEWLKQYDENNILDYNIPNTPIDEFINKELIHFSNADTSRSIGSCIDGLKTSQRKILYSCFKRKLYSEIRVAQLAGYVSEHAAYHHGEASLQGAIINMAQTFVGSNNINILMPNGQFGTRIMGGSDSASPRYIHTELNPIVDIIYPKDDMPLLNYTNDDGLLVEPEYYVPIIPMVLINGMVGIGTGFSTNIPCFNPFKIINNIIKKLNNSSSKLFPMEPYYNNFNGDIIKKDKLNYITKGKYIVDNPENKITITELPIGKWTDDYIKFIQDNIIGLKENKKNCFITDYENHSTDTSVNIIIKVSDEFMYDYEHSTPDSDGITFIEKHLKLTSNKSLNNIHLYNSSNKIQKYTISEIIDEHFETRYNLYVKRKDYLLNILKNKICILESKIRFINDIISDNIIIYKRCKKDIVQQLYSKEFILLNDNVITLSKDKSINNINTDYDYLIKMPIYSLSQEKIDEFNNELNKHNEEYNILENKTIKDMWIEELNKLKLSLQRYLD